MNDSVRRVTQASIPLKLTFDYSVDKAEATGRSAPVQVGPYRIVGIIGTGGMAEVYLAEQRLPTHREVAIKLIKRGLETPAVISQFEAEHRSVAMMDHPNIAKAYDAGEESTGRHYFAMEYFKGRPINLYADARKLSVLQRIVLFQQVCRAVQHANDKGVIHRDLKPANVLAGAHGHKHQAKLIDFGIATHQPFGSKSKSHSEPFTGSPQYMSPEQADGRSAIDARSDVYSLGVMLYELLTGSTPLTSNALHIAGEKKIKRMIRDVKPRKPSSRLKSIAPMLPALAALRRIEPDRLVTILRGNLDRIVMKAIAKNPAKRYESPAALCEDLEHHLHGLPIAAARPTWRLKQSA